MSKRIRSISFLLTISTHSGTVSCTVCTDLTAEKADLSFGGVGLKEGYTTILARTGLGLELFKDSEDRVVH